MATEFKKAAGASRPASQRPVFRTAEHDPSNHLNRHEGFFYTVPQAEKERWLNRCFSVEFNKALKAFNENCIMVRAPAVEIISSMKAADYATPAVRYVLFGRDGCGKSTSLAHVIHFAGRQGWFIAHLPWAAAYNRYYSDHQMSTYKPGRVDQTTDSAEWLVYFRRMNEPLLATALESAVPRTVERYVWNKREATEIGTPLTELIDYGVTRIKHASDVMGAVQKELRLQATAGKFRVLVAIDGLNAFWQKTTIKQEDARHLKYASTDLSTTQHWMRFLRDDWTGGAVVATLDSVAACPVELDRYGPVDLLGPDGFQLIDPFLPIAVPVYSEREAFSCIEYYRDRRWILSDHGSTEDGRRELMALSGNHPKELYRMCVNW